MEPLSSSNVNIQDEMSDDSNILNCVIYVTGGRLRGKTLGSVEKFSFSTGKWELCVPLLENRGSHGAIAVCGKIYALGGGGFHSNLATCEAFDVHDNKWCYIASMKTFRHALAIAHFQSNRKLEIYSDNVDNSTVYDTGLQQSVQNYIFAIGGWIDGKYCSPEVERYDVSLNTWSSCKPMSYARRLLGVATFGGLIYAFGGNCDDGIWYSNIVEAYNPYEDSWVRLEDMPIAGPTSCVTVDKFIYVFAHGKAVYRYNPIEDTYVEQCKLPLPEWYTFDTTCYKHLVFLHGGASKGVWSKAMFSYDTNLNTWTAMPDMLRQRRRTAAAILCQ